MTDEAEIAREKAVIADVMSHWRFGPFDVPDFSDAHAFAGWIENVRNAAFLCGARHSQLTAIEVEVMMPHLRRLTQKDAVNE